MPPEALQFRVLLLAEVEKGPLINLQTAEVRNHRRLATSPYARALQKCAPDLLYRRASGFFFFLERRAKNCTQDPRLLFVRAAAQAADTTSQTPRQVASCSLNCRNKQRRPPPS